MVGQPRRRRQRHDRRGAPRRGGIHNIKVICLKAAGKGGWQRDVLEFEPGAKAVGDDIRDWFIDNRPDRGGGDQRDRANDPDGAR